MRTIFTNRHLLIIQISLLILLCAGCSPFPVHIQNDTDKIIGAIFVERESPVLKADFYEHEFIEAGESIEYSKCSNVSRITGYVKLYSPDGLIGIWPVQCGDKFIIKNSNDKSEIEVTHDTNGRDYGVFPLNTYASLRKSGEVVFYFIWIFFMALLWFVPLSLFTFVDYRVRKDRSLAGRFSASFRKAVISFVVFFVVTIAASYLITMAAVIYQEKWEYKYIEKIRTLETINIKLLKAKENSLCEHGQ